MVRRVCQKDTAFMTLELFSLVSSLSGVTRFSMLKQNHRETVLEHTGMICCFVFVLGTKLNQVQGYKFDMAKLMQKACVHDWDETVTGDVARPTKYYSQALRRELAALEAGAIDNIADELGIASLSSLHGAAKEEAEGQLVALCDVACAIHRCWEEVRIFSNLHFIMTAKNLLRVLKLKYKELELEVSDPQREILDDFALDMHNILKGVCGSIVDHAD